MQIELLKPHTHAGKACVSGDVINLDDDLARWLVKTGSARAITQTLASAPKPLPKHEEQSK